jgi:hypothetical protein
VTNLTRRSFLQQTPISAGALGLLPAMPALAAMVRSPQPAAPQLSAMSSRSMVVHVSDVATGEMTLLVGEREIVHRDPRLVACLVAATRQGARA